MFKIDNVNSKEIKCRKGVEECNADKIHACGIKKIIDQDQLFAFVNCALNHGIEDETSKLIMDKVF